MKESFVPQIVTACRLLCWVPGWAWGTRQTERPRCSPAWRRGLWETHGGSRGVRKRRLRDVGPWEKEKQVFSQGSRGGVRFTWKTLQGVTLELGVSVEAWAGRGAGGGAGFQAVGGGTR